MNEAVAAGAIADETDCLDPEGLKTRITGVIRACILQERRRCMDDVCEYCRAGNEPQFLSHLWGGSWAHRTLQGWRRCHAAGILKRCQGQI